MGNRELAPYRDQLIAKMEEQPDITMPELALFLFEQGGVIQFVETAVQGLAHTYKKRLLASEQECHDIKAECEA